jgi:DNA (cytosine-5)-methyltransferase 1
VPNLGDITKITRDKIEALGYIDVVIFGSPCQDFSVAGKRKGLEDEHGNTTRSGLFFAAMRIADWCRARFTWLENVPGMLSSKSGRDFAAVVGAMAGAEFDLPRDGWQNAGVAVGPCGLVEWTVLDAQYHGLAQRRRRVFVVRDSGDWSDRPPLFLEQYRLQGNPAPSRKEGQSVVGTVSARTHGGGGLGTDLELDSHLVVSAYGDISHTLSSEGADASEDGSGRGTPVIAYRTAGDGAVYEEGHTTAPLTTGTDQCANVVHQSMHVRRITPLECEKLQGLPPGYTDVPYRGKRSCDGPRYKSIGNGFAIPCIRWIGDRIQAAAEGSK